MWWTDIRICTQLKFTVYLKYSFQVLVCKKYLLHFKLIMQSHRRITVRITFQYILYSLPITFACLLVYKEGVLSYSIMLEKVVVTIM